MTTNTTHCGCGAVTSRWSRQCSDCRVKSIVASATLVEPSSPLNLVDSETFYFDLDEAGKFDAGQHAHPCDEEPLGVRADHVAADLVDSVVEDMCGEAFEDAADHVNGKAELRAAFETALVAFNAAQTASSWIPRTQEVFVIPAIAAATGTAKTPQAVECEASQSGPEGIAR